MPRLSRAYAYISFRGDEFPLQEFSSLIGIEPTSIGIKGELSQFGTVNKDSFWNYRHNETDDCDGLDESLERLRIVFAKQAEVICQFMRIHNLTANCFVVLTVRKQENPGIRLSQQFIKFLSEIEASFELDGYQ